MRYLTLSEVVTLHEQLLAQSGGGSGVRDVGLLESALAQPKATFGGQDLHPTVIEKAAAATSESVMPRWKSFSC